MLKFLIIIIIILFSLEIEETENLIETLSKNKDILMNPFQRFRKETAILTGGVKDDFNSLTIGWGQIGILWQKPVMIVYVKKERYSWEFMEKGKYFTVSFLKRKHRKKLGFLGSKSGRDIKNKEKEAGLHIIKKGPGLGIIFEESVETYVCKLLYKHNIVYDVLDQDVKKFYDYAAENYGQSKIPHTEYIGEIIAHYYDKNQ